MRPLPHVGRGFLLSPNHIPMKHDIPAQLERETALVKIQTRDAAADVVALSARAGARVLDASRSAMIIEITDSPDAVDVFIDRVRHFGLLEVARSGRLTMPRDAWRASPPIPAPTADRQRRTAWAAYLMPTTPVPFTAQADGASDDAAA
jgi:hypothetical protein